jgi:hypothetical protein
MRQQMGRNTAGKIQHARLPPTHTYVYAQFALPTRPEKARFRKKIQNAMQPFRRKRRPEMPSENTPAHTHTNAFQAVNANHLSHNYSAELINHQWNTVASNIPATHKHVIAFCDASWSMNSNNDSIPLHSALAISILLSRASALPLPRFISVDAEPRWIQCEPNQTVCDTVADFSRFSPKNTFANFEKALDLAVESILETKMARKTIEELVFVIVSDMNFCNDLCPSYVGETGGLYRRIEQLFHSAGIKSVHKTSFRPPHLVFWNVANSPIYNLPACPSTPKTYFLSGTCPDIIRYIDHIDHTDRRHYDGFNLVMRIINNPRYRPFEQLFADIYNYSGREPE